MEPAPYTTAVLFLRISSISIIPFALVRRRPPLRLSSRTRLADLSPSCYHCWVTEGKGKPQKKIYKEGRLSLNRQYDFATNVTALDQLMRLRHVFKRKDSFQVRFELTGLEQWCHRCHLLPGGMHQGK